MKTCLHCKVPKPPESFPKVWKASRRRSVCRECASEYRKNHYRANAEKYKAKVKSREADIRSWLAELKLGMRCASCPEADPVCIDFHHRNSKEKDIGIALIAKSGWSLEHIKMEIAKCDPLCANCHRKLHAKLKMRA